MIRPILKTDWEQGENTKRITNYWKWKITSRETLPKDYYSSFADFYKIKKAEVHRYFEFRCLAYKNNYVCEIRQTKEYAAVKLLKEQKRSGVK